MADITVAADESAATTLIHDAEATLGTHSNSNTSSLGPFTVDWSASVSFSNGTVNLTPPNVIEIANCAMNYTLDFSFSIDLNQILPHFCFPRVCLFGLCTPPKKICIGWPTIRVPVHYADVLTYTADFALNPHLQGTNWLVDIVILGVPFLQISPAAAALLTAIGAAIEPLLLPIPFIGPFLALVVPAVLGLIGITGVTGFLGDILTPFVSGLTFTIYQQPQLFQVIPAESSIDPEVDIHLDVITAAVVSSDKNELVLTANIS